MLHHWIVDFNEYVVFCGAKRSCDSKRRVAVVYENYVVVITITQAPSALRNQAVGAG